MITCCLEHNGKRCKEPAVYFYYGTFLNKEYVIARCYEHDRSVSKSFHTAISEKEYIVRQVMHS